MKQRTYGRIEFDADQKRWKLSGEPHVMMRLKRVFPRVWAKNATPSLLDTVEVARELEWFTQRFPLAMSKADAARLAQRAAAHRTQEIATHKVLTRKTSKRKFDLAVPARDYQKIAAELCLTGGGLLLADTMGLGKSCSAICMITAPEVRPALVVTLTHLPKQWQAEFSKFAPWLDVHILKTTTPYPLRNRRGEYPDVIVTSYSKIYHWAEELCKVVRSVTYDEPQELRSGDSLRCQGAYQISDAVQWRMGLTGTPVHNYGGEIYNVLRAIRPQALGTENEFRIEWCGGNEKSLSKPEEFGSYLRSEGIMLRRTKEEVGIEVPPYQRIVHEIEYDQKALDKIEGDATALARIILDGREQRVADDLEQMTEFRARSELSILVRQATGIAKAPYAAAFVRMCIESGEPVLLSGWHHACYDIWRELLADLKPAFFTGLETPAQKEKEQRRFLSGDTDVLIMSIRAGAGLDGLQARCHTTVHAELDWSPAVHDQFDCRVYRPGQNLPVTAYYLVADGGSDPIVSDVLGLKAEQLRGLLSDGTSNEAAVVEHHGGSKDIRRLAELYMRRRKVA